MEVFGTVAAGAQLLQLCSSVILGIDNLYKKLRHAPAEIQQTAHSVETLHRLAQNLRSVLQSPGSSSIAHIVSPQAVAQALDLLRECNERCTALNSLLQQLLPQSNDGWVKGQRQAFKAVRYQDEVKNHLRRLKALERLLSAWFDYQIFILCSKITKFSSQLTTIENRVATVDQRLQGFDAAIQTINSLQDVHDLTPTVTGLLQGYQHVIETRLTDMQTATHARSLTEAITGRIDALQLRVEASCDNLNTSAEVHETFSRLDHRLQSMEERFDKESDASRASFQGVKSYLGERTEQIIHTLETGFDSLQSSFQVCDPLSPEVEERKAHTIGKRLASKPSLVADLLQHEKERWSSLENVCVCRRLGRQSRLMTFGPISVNRRCFGKHRRGCPYHGRTDEAYVETRLALRCYLTLSRAIEMVFSSAHGAGGFSLAPRTSFIYMVDGDSGPGFSRFRATEGELRTILKWFRYSTKGLQRYPNKVSKDQIGAIQQALRKLHRGLVDDFSLGTLSARIETPSGTTLLHKLVGLMNFLWPVQNDVYGMIRDITEILIKRGVPVNAMEKCNDCWYNRWRTASSIIFENLQVCDIVRSEISIFLLLLSNHDAVAFPFTGRGWTNLEIGIFPAVLDLAIESGCSRLSLAIIRRDRTEVDKLVRVGARAREELLNITLNGARDSKELDRLNRQASHNVNDMMAVPYSPLCFAIGWPAGIRTLLDAGANPSTAIHCAISYEDDVSLKAFLDGGSLLYAPSTSWRSQGFWQNGPFSESVLSYALWHARNRSDFEPNIIPLIIRTLIRTRRSLMTLAKENLSLIDLNELGWTNVADEGTLLDSAAAAVFRRLEKDRVEMPDNLRPRPMKTVYHDAWMTAEVAETLYKAGFKEVDMLDDQGFTPLLLNCHNGGCSTFEERTKCLLWFLRNGANQIVFPVLRGNSLIHYLAATLSRKSSAGMTDSLLRKLLKEICQLLPPDTRDDCYCFCSKGGCSYTSTLLKYGIPSSIPGRLGGPEEYGRWKDKKCMLERWQLLFTSREMDHSSYADACRFEIFERLGMRHTCCKFVDRNFGDLPMIETLPLSEVNEFHEEDKFLQWQLDALTDLYDNLYRQFREHRAMFWNTWWTVLQAYVPEEVFVNEVITFSRKENDTLPIPEDELDSVLQIIEGRVLELMKQSLGDLEDTSL